MLIYFILATILSWIGYIIYWSIPKFRQFRIRKGNNDKYFLERKWRWFPFVWCRTLRSYDKEISIYEPGEYDNGTYIIDDYDKEKLKELVIEHFLARRERKLRESYKESLSPLDKTLHEKTINGKMPKHISGGIVSAIENEDSRELEMLFEELSEHWEKKN